MNYFSKHRKPKFQGRGWILKPQIEKGGSLPRKTKT